MNPVRLRSFALITGLLASATCNTSAQTTSAPKNDPKIDVPSQPTGDAPVVSAPLAVPKYLNLRYDEDFSYLDSEPGAYTEDPFDPIKNIRLSDDLRLSIGGEVRFRMESATNVAYDAVRGQTQDNVQLYRTYVHFDLKYRDTARVFLQLGSALIGDRERPTRGIDENRFTLQQLFFDLRPFGDGTPLTLRVGRQDLQYGKQRFVSPLDWANTRRRFDAVKVFWTAADWQLDVFYAKPVVVRPEHPDRYNEEFDFYGAYFTYTGFERHGVDVFFFGVDDTRNRRNPNGNAGDVSRYTLGGRFWGKTGNWDYETMLAGQWGTWAGDPIQAWAWTVDGGYTFAACSWKPRIGAAFDYATGDHNPRSNTSVGTFDQLFPLGHAYLGYLDLIGRQNINAFNLNLTAWPVPKKLKAQVAWHTFWLNAKEDFLYNAGGAPGRRDPLGHSGREVGQEFDLTLLWKIDRHSTMLVGYSHFWDNAFITHTGSSEDPDLFYLQYAFKF
jgi:hypothetical protein